MPQLDASLNDFVIKTPEPNTTYALKLDSYKTKEIVEYNKNGEPDNRYSVVSSIVLSDANGQRYQFSPEMLDAMPKQAFIELWELEKEPMRIRREVEITTTSDLKNCHVELLPLACAKRLDRIHAFGYEQMLHEARDFLANYNDHSDLQWEQKQMYNLNTTFASYLQQQAPEIVQSLEPTETVEAKLYESQHRYKDNVDEIFPYAIFINEKTDKAIVLNNFDLTTGEPGDLFQITKPTGKPPVVKQLTPSNEYLAVEVTTPDKQTIVTKYQSAEEFISQNDDLCFGTNGISEHLESECLSQIAQETDASYESIWEEREAFQPEIDAYTARHLGQDLLPLTLIRLSDTLSTEYNDGENQFRVISKVPGEILHDAIQTARTPSEIKNALNLMHHTENFKDFDPDSTLIAFTAPHSIAHRTYAHIDLNIVAELCNQASRNPVLSVSDVNDRRSRFYIFEAQKAVDELTKLEGNYASITKQAKELIGTLPYEAARVFVAEPEGKNMLYSLKPALQVTVSGAAANRLFDLSCIDMFMECIEDIPGKTPKEQISAISKAINTMPDNVLEELKKEQYTQRILQAGGKEAGELAVKMLNGQAPVIAPSQSPVQQTGHKRDRDHSPMIL